MLNWINKKRNQKGFTLVELVVVIAILGILAAIAVPRLTGFREDAKHKSEATTARTIASAVTMYQAKLGSAAEPKVTELTEYLNDAAGLGGANMYSITYKNGSAGEIQSITTPSGTWTPGAETITPKAETP